MGIEAHTAFSVFLVFFHASMIIRNIIPMLITVIITVFSTLHGWMLSILQSGKMGWKGEVGKIDPKQLKPDYFRGIYKEFAELLGTEAVLSIHKHFSGQSVNLSKKLFSDIYVRQYILAHYDGRNSREVAKELLLTPNWITRLYRKYRSEEPGSTVILKYEETGGDDT